MAGKDDIIPGTEVIWSPHRSDVGFDAIHIVSMDVQMKRIVVCIVASAGVRCKVNSQSRRV